MTNKKIVIATHVYTTGPAQDLKEYLIKNRIARILFIGHPLFYNEKLTGSGFELYAKGKKAKEKYYCIRRLPLAVSYLKDMILNLYWTKKFGGKWDIFIGSDNLNALCGIILKKFGFVKKTIYYVIDYNPKRFNNNLLNKFYHRIDQYCVSHCDETWNLSAVMTKARKKYFDYEGGNQIEAPIGIWFDRIKRIPFEKIDPYSAVYMGHVMKKQGIQYIIEAIPRIIKEIPKFNLLVIGDGPYSSKLKILVAKLKISKHVKFTGFIDRHEDVENMLVKCSIGVAFYEKYDDGGNLSFTHFTDPGKLKSYLASGLIVLTTDVPPNAKLIVQKKCGMVVKLNKTAISEQVIELMKSKDRLKSYRKNAIEFASSHDWEKIFSRLLVTK